MNYISQLNAFDDWLECNYLTATEELLWYKLMSLNNRFGWSEWFFVTNPVLMAKAQIRSEHTLIKARNKLKQVGLIDFTQGKKGQPTKYKMINLYENTAKYTAINAGNNAVQSAVFPAVKPAVQSADNKDLDINKESNNAREEISILKIVEQELNRPLDGFKLEIVHGWIKDFSHELILEAMRVATLNESFALKYIDRTLIDWDKNNIKTVEQAREYCLKRNERGEQKRGSGAYGSRKPSYAGTKASQTDWENEPSTLGG